MKNFYNCATVFKFFLFIFDKNWYDSVNFQSKLLNSVHLILHWFFIYFVFSIVFLVIVRDRAKTLNFFKIIFLLGSIVHCC